MLVVLAALILLAVAGWFAYWKRRASIPTPPVQRALTRITFDDGLQTGATWSPDGRFIAYSSDRGGKYDIWVQQISGGNPIQITKSPGENWMPDWSPDGKYIAYRSEEGEGGIYITPALGGADDIHNLWPQSYGDTVWNDQVKDALEDHLRDLVCEGQLDLATAQREIATNWIAAYKKYFHTDRPLTRFR